MEDLKVALIDIDRHILSREVKYTEDLKNCYKEFNSYWNILVEYIEKADAIYWGDFDEDK